MNQLLLVGEAPLPDSQGAIRTAAALRTWHFLIPILGLKIPTTLLTINPEQTINKVLTKKTNKDFQHLSIPKNESLAIKTLRKLFKTKKYKAVVGINNYPSFIVAKANPQIPFWADLNGWLMAEAQAQAGVIQNDAFLPFLWQREKKILTKCDKISTVSSPQKYAILGELAALGRLNSTTHNYNFISVIPNATEKFPTDTIQPNHVLFRGKKIPADAFVIAFIGGYNTWVDEITLFKGVAGAIKKNEKIHFVSTGGAIQGLNNITFKNFLYLIDHSPFAHHFHFLGWVKTKDIPHVYTESDCGINVDKICTETLTGARNRINEMLKFELPVITTLGSEIAEELKSHHIGLTCASGNHQQITQAILKLADDHDLGAELAQKGKKYWRHYCSYQYTLKQLLAWLNQPTFAPKTIVNISHQSKIQASFLYLKQQGWKGILRRIFK
jgi:glycosyltransferase involved in cell wall biosynthesis